jgi:hypothetical protein
MSKIQDLNEFINLLDQGYTNEQLAAKYSCGITTIKRFKSKHSLVGFKTNSKPLSNKEILQVTSLVENGKSLSEISQLTAKSEYVLKKYLPDELYTRIISNSRNAFSRNLVKADIRAIFQPCEHSAYICGVLQSDGYITSDGYIGLTARDRDFVDNFAKFFKTSVREVTKNDSTYYGCRFKDVRNIEKFKNVTNILPQKTYTSYNIPAWILTNESYMFHFIAGVFDGDGWVYKVKDRKDTFEIGIEQHANSKPFLDKVNEYLGWSTYGTDNTYRVQTKSKSKVKEFYDWYSQIDYIMLRKVSVFDESYL